MNADEKKSLAGFIDLTAAFYGSGYCAETAEYNFADDPQETAPVTNAAAVPAEAVAVSAVAVSANEKNADGDAALSDSLEQIAAEIHNCEACRLYATRKNVVPGEGVKNPLVMVIGEGPGADEDASGRPFVGPAGQLLDKMLAAIGLSRKTNSFIANVVKCRPPENRRPMPDETGPCAAFLERQIRLLQPGFILCAGRSSSQSLLKTDDSIGAMRGKIVPFETGGRTIPLIVTYHPSALLRNEDLKRPAWEDLKILRSAIEQAGAMTANATPAAVAGTE